jgi:hypothetical protein
MAWERELSWIPNFSCVVGDIALKGSIFAPCGRDADLPGAIIVLSLKIAGPQTYRSRSVPLVCSAIASTEFSHPRV